MFSGVRGTGTTLNNLAKALMITVKTIPFFTIYYEPKFLPRLCPVLLCVVRRKPQDERGKLVSSRKNAELTV